MTNFHVPRGPSPPMTSLLGQEPVDEATFKGDVPELSQTTIAINQDHAPKDGWVTVKCEV